MEWISVKEKLPPISYVESDDEDHPYEGIHFLLYSTQKCMCVGYLVKDQDEKSWNHGDLSWEVYIPNEHIEDVDFEKFTHWMPLPKPPLLDPS